MMDDTNLIFGSFCVQHGEKHVSVSVSVCTISSEDFSEGGWGGLEEMRNRDEEGGTSGQTLSRMWNEEATMRFMSLSERLRV
jgi:hypothetical protein